MMSAGLHIKVRIGIYPQLNSYEVGSIERRGLYNQIFEWTLRIPSCLVDMEVLHYKLKYMRGSAT